MHRKVLLKTDYYNFVEVNEDGATMAGLETLFENVVVLPVYLESNGQIEEIGVHYECNPLKEDLYSHTCITGDLKDDETPFDAAKRELKEESGISQDDDTKWTYLGELSSSKITNQIHHCFSVDVTNLKPGKRTTDGSKQEEKSKYEQLPLHKLMTSQDGFILSMIMKYFVFNYREIFSNTPKGK